MSKTTIRAPDPGDQERQLQSEQTALLREQRDILSRQLREQNLLAPYLYKQAGVNPKFSETGEIIGFDEIADPLAAKRKQIEEGLLDRSLAGLRGELPTNPTLLRELNEQEATLRESLRKNMGPGYEMGDPGGRRLADFSKRRTELIDAGARGDLTLGEQLGLARESANQDRLNNYMARLFGMSGRNAGIAGGLGSVASGYNPIMQNLLANRQMQFQSRAITGQLDLGKSQQMTGILGDIIGAAAMGAGAAASTAKVKKHIQPFDKDEYRKALRKVRDMPITRWRYLWEADDREPHVGPILEMAPKEIKHDENHLSLLDYIGLTTAAVKGLDREVQTLRQVMGR